MVLAMGLVALVEACGSISSTAADRPLSSVEVRDRHSFGHVRHTVAAFADRNHFAVQPIISRPQGRVEFSMRLFRDDVSLIITRLDGGPIEVAAYPLCVCEIGCRAGLQEAADSAVADLKARLGR
jgi:hypothetical protein